jgi:hypothetical protein
MRHPAGREPHPDDAVTAADPLTATLAWAVDQNSGQVSTLRGRVPVSAVVGRLAAGEDAETVAGEFGLTVGEVTVLDRLRADIDPEVSR